MLQQNLMWETFWDPAARVALITLRHQSIIEQVSSYNSHQTSIIEQISLNKYNQPNVTVIAAGQI